MTNSERCPLCSCYHAGDGMQPCPNYFQLRDALFGSAEVELSEREAATLRWLAGIADGETRAALASIFEKSRRVVRN